MHAETIAVPTSATGQRPRRVPNVTLYNLRDATAQSQQDLADALQALAAQLGENVAVTASTVSRWERGVVRPAHIYRRLLAQHFGVTVAELGLTQPRTLHTALATQ